MSFVLVICILDRYSYFSLQTGNSWIYMYPEGLKDVLMIMKNKYGNPPIYITENGK